MTGGGITGLYNGSSFNACLERVALVGYKGAVFGLWLSKFTQYSTLRKANVQGSVKSLWFQQKWPSIP